MSNLKIPRHTQAELEARARQFLETPGITKFDNRMLLIEHIIESSLCGYTIVPVPGLGSVADAFIPVDGKRIYIDEDQYLNASFRVRFTLAEELSHIILHVPLFSGMTPDQIVEVREKISDPDYLAIEREAKFLAGCLLMPQNFFVERFNHFVGIKSQRTANERSILLYVFGQLSMDFNVSRHSCALRALKLNLIDQDQMDAISEFFSK